MHIVEAIEVTFRHRKQFSIIPTFKTIIISLKRHISIFSCLKNWQMKYLLKFLNCFSRWRNVAEIFHSMSQESLVSAEKATQKNTSGQDFGKCQGTGWAKQSNACQHLLFTKKKELGKQESSGSYSCSDHAIVGPKTLWGVRKEHSQAQALNSRWADCWLFSGLKGGIPQGSQLEDSEGSG